MRNYKNLQIWQRSLDFSVEIYNITNSFPSEEKFGLTSQIRRAVTSIPINIAEGCGRDSLKDMAHFIHIAEGSASEVECELILANRLGFISIDDFQSLMSKIDEIKKMIATYKKRIESDIK